MVADSHEVCLFRNIISALASIHVAWSVPFMLGFDKMYNYWKYEQLGD